MASSLFTDDFDVDALLNQLTPPVDEEEEKKKRAAAFSDSDIDAILNQVSPAPEPPSVLGAIVEDISKMPQALASGVDAPLEAIATTAKLAGAPGTEKFLRDLTTEPAPEYDNAGAKFINAPEGEFRLPLLDLAPQYAPRAVAEQAGQLGGTIASGLGGRAAGGLLGALTGNPVVAAAGAKIGQFAGPFLFQALQVVGPTAYERAKNDGREEPNATDVAAALSTAAISGTLDTLGAKLLPGGNEAVGPFVKRFVNSLLGESLTEGTQSVVQQVGGSVGTAKGTTVDYRQAAGEAVLGGLTGGAATAVEGAATAALGRPEPISTPKSEALETTADAIDPVAPATAAVLRQNAVVEKETAAAEVDMALASEALNEIDETPDEETSATGPAKAPEPEVQGGAAEVAAPEAGGAQGEGAQIPLEAPDAALRPSVNIQAPAATTLPLGNKDAQSAAGDPGLLPSGNEEVQNVGTSLEVPLEGYVPAPKPMTAEEQQIKALSAWYTLSPDDRELLADRLQARLDKNGKLEWKDVTTDHQNKIGSQEALTVQEVMQDDPQAAIDALRGKKSEGALPQPTSNTGPTPPVADKNVGTSEKVPANQTKPKELFHGTQAKGDFSIPVGSDGDLGAHVGSMEQAKIFAGDTGRILKVPLTVKKSLRLRDVGNWKRPLLIFEKNKDLIFDANALEAKLRNAAEAATGTKYPGGDLFRFSDDFDKIKKELAGVIRDHLAYYGYDSVVYNNTAEKGGDSYILFPAEKPAEGAVAADKNVGTSEKVPANQPTVEQQPEVQAPILTETPEVAPPVETPVSSETSTTDSTEAGDLGAGATPPPQVSPAPSPLLEDLKNDPPEDDSEYSIMEKLGTKPAKDAIALLGQAGSKTDTVVTAENAPLDGETLDEWSERTGISTSDFDTRETRYNGKMKVYEQLGDSPATRISMALRGEAALTPSAAPVDTAPIISKEEEEIARKAEAAKAKLEFDADRGAVTAKGLDDDSIPAPEREPKKGAAAKPKKKVEPMTREEAEVFAKESGGTVNVSETGEVTIVLSTADADQEGAAGETAVVLNKDGSVRKVRQAAPTFQIKPEETPEFRKKIAKKGESQAEKDDPTLVDRMNTVIDEMARRTLGNQEYKDKLGNNGPIPAFAIERISFAARMLYLARLRNVAKGSATPSAVIADVKKKMLAHLMRRVNVDGNSLDTQTATGVARVDQLADTNTKTADEIVIESEAPDTQALFNDSPIQTQDQQDSAEGSTNISEDTEPDSEKSVELMQFDAIVEAVATLSPQDQAFFTAAQELVYDGKVPASKNQKRVFEQVMQLAAARMKEKMAVEVDVDPKTGDVFALNPDTAPQGAEARKSQIEKNSDELIKILNGKTGVKDALKNIAADKTRPQWLRTAAKLAAAFDYGTVKFQAVTNRRRAKDWAGLYTPGNKAGDGKIQLNLAANHHNDIATTIVHEAFHHILRYKMLPGYPKNDVEKAAIRDLKKILTYLRKNNLTRKPGETYSTTALRENKEGKGFFNYMLSDVDELVSVLMSDPEMMRWLNGQNAIEGLDISAGRQSYWQTLGQQIRAILTRFIHGSNVRPGSLLEQAVGNILTLSARPVTTEGIQTQKATMAGDPQMNESAPAAVQPPITVDPKLIRDSYLKQKYESTDDNTAGPLPEQISRILRESDSGRDLQTALGISLRSLRGVRQTGKKGQALRTAVHAAEARDLKAWAIANGMFIPEAEFNAKWEEGGKRGESEHQVYFDAAAQLWWKRNTLNFHDGSISAYLERIAAQAFLFPSLTPEFKGFTEFEGEVMPVISQPHASGTEPTEQQIMDALKGRGFIEVFETGKGMTAAHRLAIEAGLNPPPLPAPKRVGFYNPELKIWLEDVHEENASLINGEVGVFDPVLYFVGNIPGMPSATAAAPRNAGIKQAVPALVKASYDPATDIFRDVQTGESFGADEVGKRLADYASEPNGRATQGGETPDPQRVGGRTFVRYTAEKSALSRSGFLPDAGGSNRTAGSLDGSFYAAPVKPAFQGTHPLAEKATALFRAAQSSDHIEYIPMKLGDRSARSSILEGGRLLIEFDPDIIASRIEDFSDTAAKRYVESLVDHEEAHAASFLSDYLTPDSKGRLGDAKLIAFHDEVMSESMRKTAAESYLHQSEDESDASFKLRVEEIMENKIQIVAEFKRQFLQRARNGYSEEEILTQAEEETGSKFVDFLNGMIDYAIGQVRRAYYRLQATLDPRIGAEFRSEMRMLRLLMDKSGKTLDQLLFERYMKEQYPELNKRAKAAGYKGIDDAPYEMQMQWATEWSAARPKTLAEGLGRNAAARQGSRVQVATAAEVARFNELTKDFTGDIEAFKAANPEAYAELEKMRAAVLKRAGYDVEAWHGTPDAGFTVFKDDLNKRGGVFFSGRKYYADIYKDNLTNVAAGAKSIYHVFLRLENPGLFESGSKELGNQRQQLAEIKAAGHDGAYMDDGDFASISSPQFKPFGDSVPGELDFARENDGFLTTEHRTDGIVVKTGPKPAVRAWKKFYEAAGLLVEATGEEAAASDVEIVVFSPEQIKSADPLALDENGKLITPDQWADTGSPDIRYAAPWVRKPKRNTGGWKASGLFGQGDMDMRLYNRLAAKDAEVRAASFRVQETARKFSRVVKKRSPDADTLRMALGTTDNKLSEAQNDQYLQLKKTDPVAAEAFKTAEVQSNIARAKAERQYALGKLDPEVAAVVEQMRADIDRQSNTLIRNGMISTSLQATVGANLEVYLNRSYEIFDNPDYAEFIRTDMSPESVAIRNNALTMLRAQATAQKAKEIRRAAKLAGAPVPSRASALATAAATLTPEEVQNLFDSYLAVADDSSVAILGGKLPGRKNFDIMTMRGQIPEQIRALWGEYKDPEVNYAKTYMKMSRFIAEHTFQQDFLNLGLNSATPFLWKAGTSAGATHPQGWVEIYGSMSDHPHPNPMSGVYGPKVIRDALMDLQKTYKHNKVTELLNGLTGFAMASKTVYNIPQSNTRNFLGNGLIMLANGYLTQDAKFINRFLNSFKTVGPTLVGLKPERNQAITDYVERLIGLGIVGDNVKANVVKELTKVVFDRDPATAFDQRTSAVFKFAKGVNDRMVDAYGAGDDFWKILAFETERDLMAQAFPKATSTELDRMAADRVVDKVPTYSRIPKIVQDVVKKQMFTAPFISWTSEILRTSMNTLRMNYQDAMSSNPVLKKSGIKGLISFAVAQGILVAAAAAVRQMIGMTDDDEEDLRRFLPEWQKDALLMPTKKTADGKVSFIDLSFLDPYNVLKEPFIAASRAMLSEKDPWEAAKAASAAGLAKTIEPWTAEQLLFGALVDVARGVDKNGRPLYEKADSDWNKAVVSAGRVANSLVPGTVNIAKRIINAATGTVASSGRSYSLFNELAGPIVGQRLTEADPLQSFQLGKVGAFQRMDQSAKMLATKAYKNRGTIDTGKISEDYTQANTSRREAFEALRKDIDAMRRLGVPEMEIRRTLGGSGIPKDTLTQVLSGVYTRYTPSAESIETGLSRPDGQERLRTLREAIQAYPATQRITD